MNFPNPSLLLGGSIECTVCNLATCSCSDLGKFMGNCGKLFPACGQMLTGVEAKPLKKVNKPYKIRREGSFVNGFR